MNNIITLTKEEHRKSIRVNFNNVSYYESFNGGTRIFFGALEKDSIHVRESIEFIDSKLGIK